MKRPRQEIVCLTARLTGCQKTRDVFLKILLLCTLSLTTAMSRTFSEKKVVLYQCVCVAFSWLHFLIIIQGCPWGLIAFWILIFATACLLSIRAANLFYYYFGCYHTTKQSYLARCLGLSPNYLTLISALKTCLCAAVREDLRYYRGRNGRSVRELSEEEESSHLSY